MPATRRKRPPHQSSHGPAARGSSESPALAMIGIAFCQGYRGITQKFLDDSKTERDGAPGEGNGLAGSEPVGHLAAAWSSSNSSEIFLDQSGDRYSVARRSRPRQRPHPNYCHRTYGSYALGIIAAGLIAFAIYSLSDARYRKKSGPNNHVIGSSNTETPSKQNRRSPAKRTLATTGQGAVMWGPRPRPAESDPAKSAIGQPEGHGLFRGGPKLTSISLVGRSSLTRARRAEQRPLTSASVSGSWNTRLLKPRGQQNAHSWVYPASDRRSPSARSWARKLVVGIQTRHGRPRSSKTLPSLEMKNSVGLGV